jgi:histidinol dehydrogenase
MKKYTYPDKSDWKEICERPSFKTTELNQIVLDILREVREKGDQALRHFAKEFDGVETTELAVTEAEINAAELAISVELKKAIQLAKNNISTFHAAQKSDEKKIETAPGVSCWRRSVAIEKVGLYIPGGSAPLFSTVLMLGIPAQLAGCKEIVLCTPPRKDGTVDPVILYTANLLGIRQIYRTGGAQAIAAMTYGTESIPNVYKIFGPGNQFVTKAKELVQQEGVAIDMPAGPSEVLIIADDSCVPAFVAADLLSQAEHGKDSQVILLSDSAQVLDAVEKELELQLELLPRKDVAKEALKASRAVLCRNLSECMELSNFYAPEHLIIASLKSDEFIDKVVNAGSVFLGNYSCESAGDYASGTNHTLPTNGYARSYSGVSLDSFLRKITFQQLTAEGIRNIGPSIECMAEAEQLLAHKNAVTLRLKDLNNV